MGKTAGEWYRAFKATGVLTGDTKNDGKEHVAFCPNCEDVEESSSPSASFNFKKMKFYCFSCKKQFSFKDLLTFAQDDARERRAAAGKEGGEKKQKTEEPLPSSSQIERWCRDLWANQDALQKFKDKRGLSDATIEKYQIGYQHTRKRYTIPIYDRQGDLVNIRYYGLTSKAKMINHTGHGEARLLGWDALEEDEILLVEGEGDWLSGLDKGFNTMTWTSGVSTWQDRWSNLFEGKTVFICFDNDEAGRLNGRKVGLSLERSGAKVHIVQLNIANIKGGDLTDYFHNLGNTAGDFRALMEESRHTVAGHLRRSKKPEGEPQAISVQASLNAENFGQPTSMIATVHGKATAPTILPRKVEFVCGQDWGDKCKKCALSIYDGKRELEFEATDRDLMAMVDKSDEAVHKATLKLAGIPPTCPRVDVYQDRVWTVEELQVMPSIDSRSEEVMNPVDRTVYNFSDVPDLEINKTYQITGMGAAHPRDQRAIYQSWGCEPVQVDIERFQMTPEIYEQLKIFQPDDWQEQSVTDKLKEIAYDLSINVTRIYGRPELHIGLDLVWHSVNSFYFKRQLQIRGWTECLIIGDTRTGKSEAAARLMEHYTSGALVNADRASFAGLVGGASQKGASKQWGITWGIIPLNDRRLVILDEAGGLSPQDISAMSSVRSSGVAEIVKMGGRKTSARTRLVWIANPVTNRPIVEMANGVMDEIGEFIPTPEDIARFDFAMAAARDDVPTEQINEERIAKTAHIHHADDCKQLITWVWSRKPEDIKFQRGVEEYIYDESQAFARRYVPDLPLVQEQSFHLKLARLAVAVAARLFSTDDTGEKVIVRKEHVDTVVKFLNSIYGMDSFGYKQFSSRKILDDLRAKRNRARTLDLIWNDEDGIRETLIQVMNQDKFKNRDFEERGGMMKDEAQQAAQKLLDYGMLRAMSRGYLRMTPVMLEIMREVRRQNDQMLDEDAAEEDED